MKQTQEPPSYTGVDNLEVMEEAHNYNSWLVRALLDQVPSSARVLDFGAGSGTFAKSVRRNGVEVTCIEPDATLREVLRQSGLIAYPGLSDLPDDRQFDFIYSLNVLEHIEDDGAAIKALAGRLCAGGTLLIYVPAFTTLFTAMDRRVGHLRRYRLRELTCLVREAGLDVLEARYADCLGFVATLIYRFLGSQTGAINRRALMLYDRMAFPVSRRLDLIFGQLFGKNALIVSRRTPGANLPTSDYGIKGCAGPANQIR